MAEAGYPNGEGFPEFKLWTYPAGEAPFMPELAQLMSDMWEEHLGVKSTVEVSDGARTRELWWGREIDGDWHVRPNEIEWDGGGGASALYGQLDNEGPPLGGPGTEGSRAGRIGGRRSGLAT